MPGESFKHPEIQRRAESFFLTNKTEGKYLFNILQELD